MDSLQPFRVEVPDEELAELYDRLDRVRWAAQPEGGEGYGVSRATVAELVAHWRYRYDWRAWEARLNAQPQFVTMIDGTTVHFLHVRSPQPGALPLVLSHGWPGTVAEFLDILGPLSDPTSHGLDDAIAFHLVVPSLPGSGWSGPTPDAGWGPRRIARAWTVLMDQLGYRRYGAVGNDWGSVISCEVGRLAPTRVAGIHVTQLHSLPPGERPYRESAATDLDALSDEDRAAVAGLRWFQRNLSAYHHVQAQQPQTLAHALADSPVGLLGWHSQVMAGLDTEALLTHVSIHWLTGTAGSALRIYADDEREEPLTGPTTVPLGLAQFPNDARPIWAYARRDHANVVSHHTYDRGGHYAARQAPDLLVDDIRAFFGQQRAIRRSR